MEQALYGGGVQGMRIVLVRPLGPMVSMHSGNKVRMHSMGQKSGVVVVVVVMVMVMEVRVVMEALGRTKDWRGISLENLELGTMASVQSGTQQVGLVRLVVYLAMMLGKIYLVEISHMEKEE